MGIMLATTGMPVHNLSFRNPTPLPNNLTFLAALEKAVTAPGEESEEAMGALLTRRDLGGASEPGPFVADVRRCGCRGECKG